MITVRGNGIAASCCVYLLNRNGRIAQWQSERRGGAVPALLLSDAALALLRDVFDRPALLARQPRIRRRVVAWGGEPLSVPHSAIVVSGAALEAELGVTAPSLAPANTEGFTIHTATPFPAGELREFGSRRAHAVPVLYRFDEDEDACWMEAVESGWLFCIPTGNAQGWLLAVGASYEELFAQSRYLKPRLAMVLDRPRSFDTQPRILDTLQGPDWLACGTAALAFDPICGDGTAQAVREAILAAATAEAIQRGEPPIALRRHYESMLLAAMRRHLKLCGDFYASGGQSPWWRAQHAALVEGYHWCSRRLALMPPPQYMLRGYSLMPMEIAS